jgi:hypothetical protein
MYSRVNSIGLICIVTACSGCSTSPKTDATTTPAATTSATATRAGTSTDANKLLTNEKHTPALSSSAPAIDAEDEKATTSGPDGEVIILAHSVDSGNTYTLRADVSAGEVERLYFPNGGSVGFASSDIDRDGDGSGIDTEGRSWFFQGFADGMPSVATDEKEDKEEETE